jgi:hypothetical protein
LKNGKILTENEISRVIVDAAIEVHRELGGPGLLESVVFRDHLFFGGGSCLPV